VKIISVVSGHAAHSPRTYGRRAGVLRCGVQGLFPRRMPRWDGHAADKNVPSNDDAAVTASDFAATTVPPKGYPREDKFTGRRRGV